MNLEKKQIKKFRIIEIILILACIFVMSLLFSTLFVKEHIVHKADEIDDGWYYLDGENKVKVCLPAEFEIQEGENFILYNDLLTHEYAGKTLATKGAQYNLRILVGEEILYQYQEYDFIRNTQMKAKINCIAKIPENVKDESIALCFTGIKDGVCKISQVYVGNGPEVMHHVWIEFSITMGTVTIMAVWGVIAIAIAFFLKNHGMREYRFINVGFFLFLCGLWCLTDTSFIQEHTPYPSLICTISFYAFMLMSIPILYFVRNTGDLKKYKIIDVLIVLFSLNAVCQGLLNYAGFFEFIDMLFITHLLLVIGVSILIWILIREYLKERSDELKTILVAFAMLAASGVLALVLYWLFKIPYYGNIYEVGIVIFVIVLICGLIITMTDNILYKAEIQAYQRMAKEDKMTGLGNRRAFDDFNNVFTQNITEYDNALLIFMDLNGLKIINDTYGHSVGDELIIASANCIRKAFGEKGTCYRLGGDEFCTIILNPTQTEEELLNALDKEIQNYNHCNNKYHISIARGMAWLKQHDGSIMTISDWKYQADQKMYENKGWQRRL